MTTEKDKNEEASEEVVQNDKPLILKANDFLENNLITYGKIQPDGSQVLLPALTKPLDAIDAAIPISWPSPGNIDDLVALGFQSFESWWNKARDALVKPASDVATVEGNANSKLPKSADKSLSK